MALYLLLDQVIAFLLLVTMVATDLAAVSEKCWMVARLSSNIGLYILILSRV